MPGQEALSGSPTAFSFCTSLSSHHSYIHFSWWCDFPQFPHCCAALLGLSAGGRQPAMTHPTAFLPGWGLERGHWGEGGRKWGIWEAGR